MRHQKDKFINDYKEYIRAKSEGEVYLFRDEQVEEIVSFMRDEEIDYDLIKYDFYTIIKF